MKSGANGKWLAVLSTAAIVTVTGSARAQGDAEGGKSSGTAGVQAGASAAAEADENEESEEHEERHEEKGMLGLDLVLGGGKVPFAVQNPATASNPTVTYSRADDVSSGVQSFIAGGSLEVAEHVGVGLRVPFTFAQFSPNGSPSRSATSFGNVELEGEYEMHSGKGLELVGALGIALPTAQGEEIPPDLLNQNAQSVDATAFDRSSLSRAAASARGFEDNALFEPQRLGIIPKIALRYRMRRLSIDPYVKVENLIGTSSSQSEKYIGELVGGVRVGYWLHRQFEVAVRGWVNVGYAGSDEDKKTSFAVEPQLALRFGHLRPYAGVIFPVAGPPSENDFVGVRVGIVGAF